jgi:polyhydroxyalkanoate synthase subunit PhaC
MAAALKLNEPDERVGMHPLLLAFHAGIQLFSNSLAQESLARAALFSSKASRKPAHPCRDMSGGREALMRESFARFQSFMHGIYVYARAPRAGTPHLQTPFWKNDFINLYDPAGDSLPRNAPSVLFVPSLLNQSNIFDLMPGTSLFSYLRAQGIRPLMLSWRDEKKVSQGGLDTYVNALSQALEAASHYVENGLHVAGYCMGGILCLGAALRVRAPLKGLALLATPWDFGKSTQPFTMLSHKVEPFLDAFGRVPSCVLQLFFHALEPFVIQKKFQKLSQRALAGEGPSALFVAVEDWLGHLRPLPWTLIQECLQDWYGRNLLLHEKKLGSQVLDLSRLRNLFVVIPQEDRVVTPHSATALTKCLHHPQVLTPRLGHVGILISQKAPELVWKPLAKWIRKTPEKKLLLRQGDKK